MPSGRLGQAVVATSAFSGGRAGARRTVCPRRERCCRTAITARARSFCCVVRSKQYAARGAYRSEPVRSIVCPLPRRSRRCDRALRALCGVSRRSTETGHAPECGILPRLHFRANRETRWNCTFAASIISPRPGWGPPPTSISPNSLHSPQPFPPRHHHSARENLPFRQCAPLAPRALNLARPARCLGPQRRLHWRRMLRHSPGS
jgi:hypothetical protein